MNLWNGVHPVGHHLLEHHSIVDLGLCRWLIRPPPKISTLLQVKLRLMISNEYGEGARSRRSVAKHLQAKFHMRTVRAFPVPFWEARSFRIWICDSFLYHPRSPCPTRSWMTRLRWERNSANWLLAHGQGAAAVIPGKHFAVSHIDLRA